MSRTYLSVEDCLIQRGRMKLLDAIVEADEQRAVASSVPTEKWPLFYNGYINPIVIVELVAQTSGIAIRCDEIKKSGGENQEGGGLIVGIKEAFFFVSRIPVDAEIITCSTKKYVHMEYAEYHGFSRSGEEKLGEATIQVLRTE
ncbi:MAG: hypothetical protein KGY38_01850, partial [Desulfobacterales bacterium]|nr:hypothetical protein [Desulfobacterales bacterium]